MDIGFVDLWLYELRFVTADLSIAHGSLNQRRYLVKDGLAQTLAVL